MNSVYNEGQQNHWDAAGPQGALSHHSQLPYSQSDFHEHFVGTSRTCN